MMGHPVQTTNNCIKYADLEAVNHQLTYQIDNQLTASKIWIDGMNTASKLLIVVNNLIIYNLNLQENFKSLLLTKLLKFGARLPGLKK